MPSRTSVTQVRTPGTPSTVMTQSVHRPIPQNILRGEPFFVYRKTLTPAAARAAMIGSPALARRGFPSKDMVTSAQGAMSPRTAWRSIRPPP